MIKNSRLKTVVVATTTLAVAGCGLGLASARAASFGPNVAPLVAKNATAVSAEAASTPLDLTVWLNLHDPASLARQVTALYDPSSPSFHHWMSRADLTAFLPTAAEIAQVRQQLRQGGIVTKSVLPFGLGIRINGTTAQVEAAFHTAVGRTTIGGRMVHLTMTPPLLAGGAAASFLGLGGVDSAKPQPLLMFRPGAKARPMAAGAAAAKSTLTACFNAPATVTLSGFSDSDGTTPATASISGLAYGSLTGPDTGKECNYSPAEVRAIYGLSKAYKAGFDGTGQTIVIVDAFLEPTAEADANAFNAEFGLPSFGAGNFTAYAPDGGNSTGADEGLSFVEETALDVEWAHAIAPGAKVALVQAFSDDEEDLQSALLFAVSKHLGNVISLSFGSPEASTSPTALNIFNAVAELASAQGISIQVATGDSGDDTNMGIPSDVNGLGSSPFDTAVGGTTVSLVPPSNRLVTTGWGNNINILGGQSGTAVEDPPTSGIFSGGSGGGASRFFAKPAYQSGLPGTQRLQPDVSALADPFTGADFVFDLGGTTLVSSIGGTSLAAPIFSGMWAIFNQAVGAPAGQAAPFIAAAPEQIIHDVLPFSGPANVTETIVDATGTTTYTPAQISAPLFTTGVFTSAIFDLSIDGLQPVYENVSFGTDSSLQTTKGWDAVTGYGTPDVSAAVRLIGRKPGS